MKNKSVGDIISGALLLVQLILEIVVAVLIGSLSVLPTGLFVLLIVILLLALAVPALLMWKSAAGKREKERVAVRRLIGWFISVVIIVVCVIGTFVLGKVYSTMSAVTNNSPDKAVIGVYVLKENPAESVDDAAEYVFGVTDSYDAENTRKTVAELEEVFGKTINTKNYSTVFAMIDGLYEEEVDAIILNSAYISVMDGLDVYQDFEEKTKLLLDHAVEVVPTPTPEPTPEPITHDWHDKPQSAKDPFVVYLCGSDTRSNKLTVGRNDVNILAVVNPRTAQILLVNTPRDYYIPNPAGNGALDKLTHCGVHGVECSMKALSQLYDIPVHYSAQVNFTGFKTLIDAIGGITVYSDVAFRTDDGYWIKQGENTMNGEVALSFARERYALEGGDNDRGKNQMKVIAAVVDKLSAGTIISNYSEIMDSMQGMFATNMTTDEIMRLVKFQLSDMPQWNLVSYAVTGSHGFGETYSAPGYRLYVMRPHENTVKHASELMVRVLDGETLTAEDVAPLEEAP